MKKTLYNIAEHLLLKKIDTENNKNNISKTIYKEKISIFGLLILDLLLFSSLFYLGNGLSEKIFLFILFIFISGLIFIGIFCLYDEIKDNNSKLYNLKNNNISNKVKWLINSDLNFNFIDENIDLETLNILKDNLTKEEFILILKDNDNMNSEITYKNILHFLRDPERIPFNLRYVKYNNIRDEDIKSFDYKNILRVILKKSNIEKENVDFEISRLSKRFLKFSLIFITPILLWLGYLFYHSYYYSSNLESGLNNNLFFPIIFFAPLFITIFSFILIYGPYCEYINEEIQSLSRFKKINDKNILKICYTIPFYYDEIDTEIYNIILNSIDHRHIELFKNYDGKITYSELFNFMKDVMYNKIIEDLYQEYYK